MVKCPVCGKDVSPEEYGAHYDSHGVGARVEEGEKMEIKDIIGKTIADVHIQPKSTISGFFFNEITLTFTDGTKIILKSK